MEATKRDFYIKDRTPEQIQYCKERITKHKGRVKKNKVGKPVIETKSNA